MPDEADMVAFNARQSRYRLEAPIGRGGMSTVYRGRDRVLDRAVAIKVFRSSAADNEQLRAQQQEARLLASAAHHSLVRLFDVGVDLLPDGSPRLFLVMELVDGVDLRVHLRTERLPLLHVAHIGYDLAEGLAYLHGQGVHHRDVKPANVLLVRGSLSRRPRVKLTDLGIAQIEAQERVAEQDVTGTAAYLSPEQVAGDDVGAASDVYGLGLVVLEAITRRTEFPGGVIESAFARLDRDPAIPDDLPPAWTDLLRSMLQRRPEDRPRAEDVAESFRRLLVDEVRPAEGPRSDSTIDRATAVRRYNVLSPAEDLEADRLALLAARLVGVDGAIVAVADEDRVLIRGRAGSLPGAAATATYIRGVLEEEAVELRAEGDPAWPPLAAAAPGLAFYASCPIRSRDGVGVGVVAVLDSRPKTFDDSDRATLQDIADMAMHEFELRLAVRRHLLSGLRRSTPA